MYATKWLRLKRLWESRQEDPAAPLQEVNLLHRSAPREPLLVIFGTPQALEVEVLHQAAI